MEAYGMLVNPYMFIERMLVALVGIGMFAHFICMAAAAPTRSSNTVLGFLMFIAGFAVGMFFAAIFGDIDAMFTLLLGGICSMFLFWLWLWYQGMHVKDFLDKKYGDLTTEVQSDNA